MIILIMVIQWTEHFGRSTSSAFGVFIAWLRPQPGSNQQTGIRKELAVVLEPSSLQPAVEAGAALWCNLWASFIAARSREVCLFKTHTGNLRYLLVIIPYKGKPY